MNHDHDRSNKNNNYDDDDDVIAYIYPAVGTLGYDKAARSIRMNAASRLYLAPRRDTTLNIRTKCVGARKAWRAISLLASSSPSPRMSASCL